MRKIRSYSEVGHETGSDLLGQVADQKRRLGDRLERITRVVAVASGKGGVGKSAVTANLASALAIRGLAVGAADVDLNGPSLSRMLGASGAKLVDHPDGVEPALTPLGIRIISMELLQQDGDAPLRWREPVSGGFIWQSALETGAMREFIGDVAWGDLDVLLIDVPPGTDKILRLLELVPSLHQLLLVTTPSEAARFVVSKSIRLAREASVPVVALVANMTEHVCPYCGRSSALFAGDGAHLLAEESGVHVWAEIPFDTRLGAATDRGASLLTEEPEAASSRAFFELADRVTGARTQESP